jgi:hypothetical protein
LLHEKESPCKKEKTPFLVLAIFFSCFAIIFKQLLPDGVFGVRDVLPHIHEVSHRHQFFKNKKTNIVSSDYRVRGVLAPDF